VQHEPSLLRQFVLGQRPECAMLGALVHVLTAADGCGEKPQANEVLRGILDPEGMDGRENDDFLNLFYEEFIQRLAVPVTGRISHGTNPVANGVDEPSCEDDSGQVLSARQHVCELLCFCVQKHTYRIKYFILRNNVLHKVLKLASSPEKCLVLAALRFFRTCIGLKDEFYNRYITKNRCFDPIISQLQRNCTRDNLVHSSILELFEFIRLDNIKSLVAHVAETYKEQLSAMNHVDIFQGLLLRHEQNEEHSRSGDGAAGGGQPAQPAEGRRAFPDEADDEAYFNESDGDEAAPAVADDIDDTSFMPRVARRDDDTDGRADGRAAARPVGEKENYRGASRQGLAPQLPFDGAFRGSVRSASPPPQTPLQTPLHTSQQTPLQTSQQTPLQAEAHGSLVPDYADDADGARADDPSRKRRRFDGGVGHEPPDGR